MARGAGGDRKALDDALGLNAEEPPAEEITPEAQKLDEAQAKIERIDKRSRSFERVWANGLLRLPTRVDSFAVPAPMLSNFSRRNGIRSLRIIFPFTL
jgi:hypothetical protein